MDAQRMDSLFAAVRKRTYLDCATWGPLPAPALAAARRVLEARARGEGDWKDWEAAGERARESCAQLLGCAAQDLALMPAVAPAATLVAEQLPFRTGANLVLGTEEFRSNLFPWLLQERRGFEARMVEYPRGKDGLGDLLAAIDGNTSVVAVSHVQSSNGYRLSLEPIVEACRKHDARLFIDATQSAGALRIPLEGIDFLATGAYKWMLSPRGTAFLYVAPKHRDALQPLFASWASASFPQERYYGPPLEFADDASRFDISKGWTAWAGAAESIEVLREFGAAAIEAHDLELARRFRMGLEARGIEPLFGVEHPSAIVAMPLADPAGAREALSAAGITAAVRSKFLRLAFHIYNDEADVDKALSVLC